MRPCRLCDHLLAKVEFHHEAKKTQLAALIHTRRPVAHDVIGLSLHCECTLIQQSVISRFEDKNNLSTSCM